MENNYYFFGKKISGKMTIPAGIINTSIEALIKIANEIPEIGVLTTKSIGPSPKKGHKEPIFTQYAPGCFMNAVGLTNPGAEEFAEQLKEAKNKIPVKRFILVSIFGANPDEYVEVAKKLSPYSDGIELNLSCPNAKGFGITMGKDPKIVKEIVSKVKKEIDIPVIAKLTPNVDDIGKIAKAAEEGGADGICAINTAGPGYYTVQGNPILTNIKGGMSGKGIKPIALKCIKEISETINLPVIGCGGISSASDIREFKKAGASIFGIGSALIGLDSQELIKFFSEMAKDIDNKTENASKLLKENIDMSFRKHKVISNDKISEDFSILTFENKIKIKPGQFIFCWIPGEGEKPFSALDNEPLKLGIQARGCFTKKLIELKEEEELFIRGPYGKEIEIEDDTEKIILISGGCGHAAVFQIAKDYSDKYDIEMFIGAKDKYHLFYLEESKKYGNIHIATDDGSKGHKGFVTELLSEWLKEKKENEKLVFFNCGPKGMIKNAEKIQQQYVNKERINSSIEYPTKCGVGICGSCATENGKRMCVDGPFIKEDKNGI
ncbi:MAG: DUF561 domain-containing protein [Nanobdellota archaeon]